MSSTLFNTTDLDKDGRQLVLSNNIHHVKYYDSSLEVWDNEGAGGQSWFTELEIPNDSFDEAVVNTERWSLVGPTTRTLSHDSGSLSVGVEQDEGPVYLTSDGKWALSGDFDIRLYIDWASYYNEYRSATHSFFRVKVDDANTVRVSFSFNGSTGYTFTSEKAVGRNIKYFGWKPNGTPKALQDITEAATWNFLKITRVAGVLKTYISNGATSVQIGEDISDAVFSQDMWVDFGVDSKEFNTCRHKFTKFYVVSGGIVSPAGFFSSIRGIRKDFPPHMIAVVDDNALSLIDEDTSTLWMRFLIGSGNLFEDTSVKVAACAGVLYCTTPSGLIAVDFAQDKIYKYAGSDIHVADEPVALRGAGVTFRVHMSSVGDMADDNIHGVDCAHVGSEDYIVITHDLGITVRRALVDGVSNASDGPTPAALISISEKGSIYWTGYDADNNLGEISFYSNIAALATGGTDSFSRSGYYGTGTSLRVLGEVISAFDVRTVDNFDQLAVGSSEGVSFISQSPSASFTYGVEAPAVNNFVDPTFGNYIGDPWIPFYSGLVRRPVIIKNSVWKTAGSHSLLLRFDDLPDSSHLIEGTACGVYQNVDLTGVERVYFDINMVGGTDDIWNFEVVIGGTVVKSYASANGSFIKMTDSVVVLGYTGVQKVEFRIKVPGERDDSLDYTSSYVRVDNIQTAIGDPQYRVLPPGNAAIKEVLLQYDAAGHKVYFATAEGYGAIDLDVRSLDYFTQLSDLVPDPTTENLSADFSRVVDED